MALSSAAQEAIWLRELSSDLGSSQLQPTLIKEDNQSTISTSSTISFENMATMARFVLSTAQPNTCWLTCRPKGLDLKNLRDSEKCVACANHSVNWGGVLMYCVISTVSHMRTLDA